MIYTDLKTMKKKFYSPVKEEFYGRTKYIQNMYENCCEICDKLNSMSLYESLYYDTHFSKANKMLQENMCKEFGFKESLCIWDKTETIICATIPGGMFIEKHAGLQNSVYAKTKTEKYYDSSHEFICLLIFTNGLVRRLRLTGEELMGIMLHEIGHNFERRKYVFANLYISQCFQTFGAYELYSYIFRNGLAQFILDYQKEWPNIDFFCNVLYQLLIEFKDTVNFLSGGLVNFIQHFSYFVLTGKAIFTPLILKTEQFSDSFAAKYGFGPGLISALDKIHKNENRSSILISNLNKIPVLRTILDILKTPSRICSELFIDNHPVEEIRYENIKTDLMNDYNDPEIPKEFKPIIKQQIVQCEKLQELNKTDAVEKQKIITVFKKYLMNDIIPTKKWVDFYYH